jgi:diguanylate cyclase (GGDEF)-like protein/PAS domain S-box-containing protein
VVLLEWGGHPAQTYEWWAPGAAAGTRPPQTPVERPTDVPVSWRRLRSGRVVTVEDVGRLASGWHPDRDRWSTCGLRSVARLPIVAGGETVGALGVDAVTARRWTGEELAWLRVLAATIGGALWRERALRQLERRYRLFERMITRSSDVLAIISASGVAEYISPSGESTFGYQPEDLMGRALSELVHPEDLVRVTDRLEQVVRGGIQGEPMVVRARHAEGGWRWVEVVGTDLLGEPEPRAVMVSLRDVSDRVEAERAVLAERERYQRLIEAIPDVVIRLDSTLRPVYGNRAAWAAQRRWLRGESASPTGFDPGAVDHLVRELRDVVENASARTIEVQLGSGHRSRWYEVIALPELAEDELTVTGVLTVARDITSHRRRELELQRQALEDPLTGLANRTLLDAELTRALGGLARSSGPVGILYLDLDAFKAINDRYGHATGDRILRIFGERLRAAVRPSDVVARVGGDEFVVLPEPVRAVEELGELAARLHASLERPIPFNGGSYEATVSIGVAYATAAGADSASGLLDRGDRAMYEAKRRGRGQTSVG